MNVDSMSEMRTVLTDTAITGDLVRSVCQNVGALQHRGSSVPEECEAGSCRWYAACQTFCVNGFVYRA
jgi:hypothetical protein